MFLLTYRTHVFRLLALGCLLAALAGQRAWAVGGGTPDPSTVPLLQALRVQVDAHLALAAVGGGAPDPQGTTLNQALPGLRAQTVELRGHVAGVLAALAGIPIFEQITVTKTLRTMLATTRMRIARIDYALPSGKTPPSDL